MKKLVLIIGNGFTIDFIHKIDKTQDIDVRNLFRLGDWVKFPDSNRTPFLSHMHCPSLWLLGARPSNTQQECMSIIEEIITCSNMFFDYIANKGTGYCNYRRPLSDHFIGKRIKIVNSRQSISLYKSIFRVVVLLKIFIYTI